VASTAPVADDDPQETLTAKFCCDAQHRRIQRCGSMSSLAWVKSMRRREFVTFLGGAAVAWPLVVLAQQPIPIIWYLRATSTVAQSSQCTWIQIRTSIDAIAALRPGDYALLESHLQIVPILEGEFLHLPGEEIEQVYFLHRGIVALMAISKDGNIISTASVGSEGAIGTIAGTGFVRAFTQAMVQAAGVASRIAVPYFRRAVRKSEAINDLLTRYHMALMCQVQQTSLCNSVHDATSRLSRLLLVLSEQGRTTPSHSARNGWPIC
jgi:CRP-like cAMP-binding protein